MDYKRSMADLILQGKKNKVSTGNVTEFSQVCDGVPHTLDSSILKTPAKLKSCLSTHNPYYFTQGFVKSVT